MIKLWVAAFVLVALSMGSNADAAGRFAAIHPRPSEAEVKHLLLAGDMTSLDRLLGEQQARFEHGNADEVEIRDSYRAFYDVDVQSKANLDQWVQTSGSYAALLAHGIFETKLGQTARGGKYIKDTPREQLEQMDEFLKAAISDFEHARRQTAKPYLAVFHEMSIMQLIGDHRKEQLLLIAANEMVAKNSLVRNRYIESLMPRRGGSYREAEAFVEQCKQDGLSSLQIDQLNALIEDDKGDAAWMNHDSASAAEHFNKALLIAADVGGDFQKTSLLAANRWFCSHSSPKCQR